MDQPFGAGHALILIGIKTKSEPTPLFLQRKKRGRILYGPHQTKNNQIRVRHYPLLLLTTINLGLSLGIY